MNSLSLYLLLSSPSLRSVSDSASSKVLTSVPSRQGLPAFEPSLRGVVHGLNTRHVSPLLVCLFISPSILPPLCPSICPVPYLPPTHLSTQQVFTGCALLLALHREQRWAKLCPHGACILILVRNIHKQVSFKTVIL